jgi:hypothetical protein
MIKIENLSASEIVLKFNGKTGSYQKHLKPSSVLKLGDEEYRQMLKPHPVVLETLKISKYNIYAESKLVEIENPTSQRVSITFARSEQDIYQKTLPAKATIKLKPEEFAFIKQLDPRLIVAGAVEENQFYFKPKNTEVKVISHDVVPMMAEVEIAPAPVEEPKISLDQEKFTDDVKKYKKEKWSNKHEEK